MQPDWCFMHQHISNICPTLQLVSMTMLQLLLQDLICQQPELLHHNFIVIFNGMKALVQKPTTFKFCEETRKMQTKPGLN
jgi:hypothetical protein